MEKNYNCLVSLISLPMCLSSDALIKAEDTVIQTASLQGITERQVIFGASRIPEVNVLIVLHCVREMAIEGLRVLDAERVLTSFVPTEKNAWGLLPDF